MTAPVYSMMSLAFVGELTCAGVLVFVLLRWAYEYLNHKPLVKVDHHAELMRKYDCLMSDEEAAELSQERWQ